MFNFDAFLGYLVNPYLLGGVAYTIGLTFVPMVFALMIGTVLAVLKTAGKAPALLSVAYVWLFRGTPLLVLMVMIYTALPQIGLKFGVLTCAVLAMSLNEAAYVSEIIRAGLLSVPRGQRDAAQALGLTRWLAFLKVIGPQAMRLIIPPLGNSINGMLKATSLASVISVEELMRRGQILMNVKFEGFEIYCVIAIYYLVLTSIWGLLQTPIERRFGRGYADRQVTFDVH